MSVIAQLRIPAGSFELGRILRLESEASIELENVIALGEKAIPFFTVENSVRDDFQERVENHRAVASISVVSEHDDRTLYALDWDVSRDIFFQGVRETCAHVLRGRGTASSWTFELRFPTHERLSELQEHCANARIDLDVERIFNRTRPEAGLWFGLTERQRDTLIRAVQGGYYSIPRRMSTNDLADELGISDQAVTERLRRAIVSLAENTLVVEFDEDGGDDDLL